jgi:hypothetical protein
MKYEGEIHKVLKKAYGKGKVTHVARPDMSWEGTWVENKRTGFIKYVNASYGTVSYMDWLDEKMHGRKTDFKPAKENHNIINFIKENGGELKKGNVAEA